MTAEIVLGLDGGGTTTRALAADLAGRALAYVETGAASPHKTDRALENVQQAIREVVAQTGRSLEDVRALVAGFAGLDAPEDQQWADRFTTLPGLHCPRLHVNDAVVAHAGALQGLPGIIAISGTGSIVFGVTEAGRHLRNYDFHHYAATSARHLAYEAVYRVLAADTQAEDGALIEQICAFWNAEDVTGLRALGMQGFVADDFERTRRFGELATVVTAAARSGSPLARAVCDRAANALSLGIRLLGSCFEERDVRVALIGGAVRSVYMQQAMATELARSRDRAYLLVAPALSCAAGAILMALKLHGVIPDENTLFHLKATSARPD